MAIKREMSETDFGSGSGSGSEFEPELDIKPTTPPPKKVKTQPKTPGSSMKKLPASSPISGSGSSSEPPTKKGNRVADGAKRMIAERVIKSGIAAVDVEDLAKNTGLSVRQVRSQLEDKRSNVRKQLMELAKTL